MVRELGEASGKTVNPLVAQVFNTPPASMRDVADRYGQIVCRRGAAVARALGARTRRRKRCPMPMRKRCDKCSTARNRHAPCPTNRLSAIEWYFDIATTEMLWKLQGEVDRWLIQSPQAPAHAVALVDRDVMQEPRVFRRGNPATKGDEVPRRFLKVLSGDDRQPFAHGSGRLEMARAIASPDNPLTARVWANRVWMHHFGAGLVRTPSDFGMRSEPPTHPQLLDWLASTVDVQRLEHEVAPSVDRVVGRLSATIGRAARCGRAPTGAGD